MSQKHNTESKNEIKEMLFEDYKYLKESFWKNETIGETRVNFFITLVTAVMAALVTLLTSFFKKDATLDMVPSFVFYVILFALLMLLGVGIITLIRLIKRNKTTDGYKKDMDKIRALFKDHFDSEKILKDYIPFRDKKKTISRKPGGLLELVNFFNAILIVGIVIVSLFLSGYKLTFLVTWGIITFISLIIIHALYFYKNNLVKNTQKSKNKMVNSKLTHAGGVVYSDGKYLIITSKEGANKVFPKGHIEPGEKPKETAIREVREETGIIALPILPLATNKFEYNGELILCKYYLMIKIDEIAPNEKRNNKWLTFEKANKALKLPDLLELIKLARLHIETLESDNSNLANCLEK